MDAESLGRDDGWFRRYGDWAALFARVVPVTRSIVSIPAGTMEMPLLRFIVLTAMGSGAWTIFFSACLGVHHAKPSGRGAWLCPGTSGTIAAKIFRVASTIGREET